VVGQTPDRVELFFLDVGQGDATIVRSPDGTVALIDAGPGGEVVDVLRQHGVATIDIAIASHPHGDHIGGMEEVIQSFPIRYYMDNGLPHTTATYGDLMQVLRVSDITYLQATERTISLGSVKLKIIPPLGRGAHNNNSVGVLVEYGDFRALLTGDSEVEELQHFLSRGVPSVTVLKAPHHGSRDGLTPIWLNTIRPEVVVVSCGLNNPYGHPHRWALRYYWNVAEHVFRTDLHGEVQVSGARDGTYSVRTGRGTRVGDSAYLRNNSRRAVAAYVY
jgi:beta-lactamase superfamily II metal-dependent hydrolase